MRPDASLNIIETITIIYGILKPFYLLMRDFCKTDQYKKESIPSFINRKDGLLCKIRERLHEQIPFHEEHRLLREGFSMEAEGVLGIVLSIVMLTLG